MTNTPTPIDGTLRKFALRIPPVIAQCSGITIFGKLYRSIVFSTDLAIIRNVNADAIMAVYPFTPQPVITQAIISASDIPVFAGVGGGLTQGKRVIHMASYAEMQGAIGVVVNAPTKNEVVRELAETIDIPIIVTIAREDTDIYERVEAGMRIANVSAAAETASVVRKIRQSFPELPIIATGGPRRRRFARRLRRVQTRSRGPLPPAERFSRASWRLIARESRTRNAILHFPRTLARKCCTQKS